MKTYNGRCHCGKVAFEFRLKEQINHALRCNCSICRRLGAALSPVIQPGEIKVISGQEYVRSYFYDLHEIDWFRCGECGIFLFYNSDIQSRANLGCVDEADIFSLEMKFCDGARF